MTPKDAHPDEAIRPHQHALHPGADRPAARRTFASAVPDSAKPDDADSHLISTIKALVAKGDRAKAKADRFYIAAGERLKTLKASHDKRGGSWAEWEALLRTRCGIGKSRASELMQIADGRKSVEGIRAAEAVKHKKLRDSSSPVRTGEAEAVSNMERLEPASQTTAPALVAEPAGEPAIECAAPAKTSPGNRLLDAWEASSEEDRNAFLKAIGEDVDAYQQSTLRRGYYEGTEAALESIRKRYDKRRTEDLNEVHEQSQLEQKADEFWEQEIRWIDSVIEMLRAHNEPNCSDAIGNVDYQDFSGLDCIIQEGHRKRLDKQPGLSTPPKANATGQRRREHNKAETDLDLSSETDCNEPSDTIVGSATNNPVDEEPNRAVTQRPHVDINGPEVDPWEIPDFLDRTGQTMIAIAVTSAWPATASEASKGQRKSGGVGGPPRSKATPSQKRGICQPSQ